MVVVAVGTPVSGPALAQDSAGYPVSQLLLDFGSDLPVHPPASQLMGLRVQLGKSGNTYGAPGTGQPVTVTLGDIPSLGNASFTPAAIDVIEKTLVGQFTSWGYSGIVAAPHSDDIRDGMDVRGAGQTALRIEIGTDGTWTGVPGRPDEAMTSRPYRISQFLISFDPAVPERPPVSEVMAYQIDLSEVAEGYVGPMPGRKPIRVRLSDIAELDKHDFYPSAISTITTRIAETMEEIGFENLEVVPHPEEIDVNGRDTRFANQTALRLLVRVAPPAAEPTPAEPPTTVVPAPMPRPLTESTDIDGALYPLSQVILEYAYAHPDHPDLRYVMENTTLYLAETADGYIAVEPDHEYAQAVPLTSIPLLPKQSMYGSAIQAMSRAVVSTIAEMGFIGINVSPHPEDIDAAAQDLRPNGISALRMQVRIGRVTEMRTIASGDRIPNEERINSPTLQRIATASPVQPGAEGAESETDLMRKDEIDRYVKWLNRHPGRRVDVAVSPGQAVGGVAMDFMVTENKPWLFYIQASNTGTEQTDEWRERFGFIHNQLTGNDDVFTLDYITAGFDEAHTILASYEAPLGGANDRLRWGVNGSWSEFTASDIGFANQDFSGDEWSAGGELTWNFFQEGDLFIDLVGGVRWRHIEVTDGILDIEGEEDFFLPSIGLRMEHETETSSTFGSIELSANISGVADTGDDGAFDGSEFVRDIDKLGRQGPIEEDFMVLSWNVSHSVYLEPILWGDSWADPSTPESSTLAHELYFNFRGQFSNDRLPPQFQRTAGGLYTVRGYEESLIAADSALIFTAEYRLHLPRLFALESEPRELFGQPFRWAPQQVYGRPDWDLIGRVFFDYARVDNSDDATALPGGDNFELVDKDLMSVGGGVEFLLKRNLNLRVDYGYALEGITGRAERGDDRWHFVATLLF